MRRYRERSLLFCNGDIQTGIYNIKQKLPEQIEQMDRDQFLATSKQDLLDYFVSRFQIEPLELFEDKSYFERQETTLDMSHRFDYSDRAVAVPGTRIIVHIPFSGDAALWNIRPSVYDSSPPQGEIRPPTRTESGELIIEIAITHNDDISKFKKILDDQLNGVRQYLERQKKDIDNFNKSLPKIVEPAIENRRLRLEKHSGISSMLGIPLKTKDGAPPVQPIKLDRKITIKLPPPPKSGFKPEPGIDEKNFETILQIIRNQCQSWEKTPGVVNKLDEEDLRDLLLGNLNGIFQGQATGETFRSKGKTDILIQEGDRQAFVAECKIWEGSKALQKALDQLLSYLTWRDCKTALIVFNKSVGDFSSLLVKSPLAIVEHSLTIKDLGAQHEGEWRYICRSQEDEGRRVMVHVFLYNLFQKSD